jgi:hypothetical protein
VTGLDWGQGIRSKEERDFRDNLDFWNELKSGWIEMPFGDGDPWKKGRFARKVVSLVGLCLECDFAVRVASGPLVHGCGEN